MKNIDRLPFPGLMTDMRRFAKTSHARVVIKKCLDAGKSTLAWKIAFKYGLLNEPHDDISNAISLALMAKKRKKQ